MKTLWIVLFLLPAMAFGQMYKPSLAALKEYQGLYENSGGTTLRIAASPVDTMLYALIGEARYPLRSVRPDVFRNGGGDTVRFVRQQGNIAGYETGGRRYALLDKDLNFPPEMWFPRLRNGQPVRKGILQRPMNWGDGLRVGNIHGSGVDSLRIDSVLQGVVQGKYPDVHGILVLKDGKLVVEEYFYQFSADSLHPLRSATKSIVSALTGLAIQDKKIIGERDRVLPYFPEYTIANPSEEKQRITVADLLANTSGLACDISDPSSPGNEEVMDHSRDWVKFTLDLPMAAAPGTRGMYCSGNPITLGRIIEKAEKMPLPEYARQKLFSPLGINAYRWVFKPDSSRADDFCQLHLRPRDMAKFGQLYLDSGRWQGRQIIPKSWVVQSTAEHSVVQGVSYGYLWWRKYLLAHGVRYDGFSAQGNGGQRIFICPAQKLVVVMVGGSYNRQSSADAIIARYVLAGFNPR